MLGGGGSGNRSPRKSERARAVARAYHCSQIKGGKQSSLARITAHERNSTRGSLLGYLGGGVPGKHSTHAPKLARTIAGTIRGGDPGNRSSRVSHLGYAVARVNHSSQIGGGPGNRSPRVSQLARTIARAYHCPQIRGGPGNPRSRVPQPARVKERVYHCLHIWVGEDQAIAARVHHSSRVSLLAHLRGGRGARPS